MNAFPYAEAISRIENPLDWTHERGELMVKACREMAVFHQAQCAEVKHLYRKYAFNPEEIVTEDDLTKIPSIGVTAMKYFLVTSLPHEQAVLKLTSSGTRGQKTQIWFDQASLDRVQMMLETYWRQEGLISETPANYVLFVYDPEEAKDLGVAFTDNNQKRFAPVHSSFHTIKKNKSGDWEFKIAETVERMKQMISEGYPMRLFGIPSFVHELLIHLKRTGEKLRVPEESLMMTGGGWKAAEDKKISREEFRVMVSEFLGLKPERIRDGYGMAEHCAPYIECSQHRFHIPVYCRILVRDPVNDGVLPAGEPGHLELITPFNAMMPTLAIQSTDIGFIDPEPCPCGSSAPTFTLSGRGGLTKHKGCAIHASEIIKRA